MEKSIHDVDNERKNQGQSKDTVSPQVNALIVAGEILGNPRYLKIFIAVVDAHHSPIEISKITGIPYTTVYKFIKKLSETGIITQIRGLDKKKKYYLITQLGYQVIKHIRELVAKRKNVYIRDNTAITSVSNFKELAAKLGVSVDELARILDARIVRLGLNDPYRDKVGFEAYAWNI